MYAAALLSEAVSYQTTTCKQTSLARLDYSYKRRTTSWNHNQLEGKYSLESTDPCESEIRASRQLTIALKLSYYLFITAKLFKVKDGYLKFVYIGKRIPGLRPFWTVTSTPV